MSTKKSRYLNYNVLGLNSSNHKLINNDLSFLHCRALFVVLDRWVKDIFETLGVLKSFYI